VDRDQSGFAPNGARIDHRSRAYYHFQIALFAGPTEIALSQGGECWLRERANKLFALY
jgi:hypothetical protein